MAERSENDNVIDQSSELTPTATIHAALSQLERALRAAQTAITLEGSPVARPPTAADVRLAIDVRNRRNGLIAPGLFSDPGWELLLELYACSLEHIQPSISELTVSVGVPGTSVLRWLDRLGTHGLLKRRGDRRDVRKVRICLSDEGKTRMDQYFRDHVRWGCW